MKVTKSELKRIINEEVNKQHLYKIIKEEHSRLLLEFNVKALLKKIDDVGGVASAVKLAAKGKLFTKTQMRQIAGAIDDPGIGRKGVDRKILRAYDKQAKAVKVKPKAKPKAKAAVDPKAKAAVDPKAKAAVDPAAKPKAKPKKTKPKIRSGGVGDPGSSAGRMVSGRTRVPKTGPGSDKFAGMTLEQVSKKTGVPLSGWKPVSRYGKGAPRNIDIFLLRARRARAGAPPVPPVPNGKDWINWLKTRKGAAWMLAAGLIIGVASLLNSDYLTDDEVSAAGGDPSVEPVPGGTGPDGGAAPGAPRNYGFIKSRGA